MIRLAALSFVLASIPMSPVTAEEGHLVAKLCNGGTLLIPLGSPDNSDLPEPPEASACHAAVCRPQDAKPTQNP